MPEYKKQELIFLNDIYYDAKHTWVRLEGDLIRVGISDFAQDQLGEIVFVELPSIGDTFAKGEVFGQAESVKSVSELYIPVSGEILAVNQDIEDSPEHVNIDPYAVGWMIIVKPSDLAEIKNLLSKDDYVSLLTTS